VNEKLENKKKHLRFIFRVTKQSPSLVAAAVFAWLH